MSERRPILAAVEFGQGTAENGAEYRRLANVLRYTARKHCAGWDLQIEFITPTPYRSDLGNPSHVWNTQKLEWWRDVVRTAEDGDRILLMDADMMITRPLDDIWNQPFDLAYTVRSIGRLPFNGGVLFLRVTPKVRAFVESWWETNLLFLGDAKAHAPFRAKYAGINQASFGYMLDTARHDCHLLKLPCLAWNCENTVWAKFDPGVTRIVHMKSKLRRALFGAVAPEPHHRPLIELWRRFEQGADREAVA